MATKQHDEPRAQPEKQVADQLIEVIESQVMQALGRPKDLHRVQVRRVWGNNYRFNMFTGPDAATAKVANSFFLVVDDAGHITTSTPAIVRQY